MNIREAKKEDVDKIYALMEVVGNIHIEKDTFQKLFTQLWPHHEKPYGYVLADTENVYAFLGTIISTRQTPYGTQKICNINTWMVHPDHRDKSLLLFMPLLNRSDLSITVFTPAPQVYAVLTKLGFKDLETYYFLVYARPWALANLRNTKFYFNVNLIKAKLTKDHQTILNEHSNFHCWHLLIEKKEKYCYILFSKVKRFRMPVASIHYISDPELFQETIGTVSAKLLFRYGLLAMAVPGRFLKDDPSFSKKIDIESPHLIWPQKPVNTTVDQLYSELAILNV